MAKYRLTHSTLMTGEKKYSREAAEKTFIELAKNGFYDYEGSEGDFISDDYAEINNKIFEEINSRHELQERHLWNYVHNHGKAVNIDSLVLVEKMENGTIYECRYLDMQNKYVIFAYIKKGN